MPVEFEKIIPGAIHAVQDYTDAERHSVITFDPWSIPGLVIPQIVPQIAGSLCNKPIVKVSRDQKPGVRLKEALEPPIGKVECDKKHKGAETPTGNIHIWWPGYRPESMTGAVAKWSIQKFLTETALLVSRFYKDVEEGRIQAQSQTEWDPRLIPFDQLYVVEIRQCGPEMLQPVICYVPN